MKIFNKNFFFGVGAGVLITILILVVGGYLLIWWFSSQKIPGGEKILNSSLEAPPFPSAVLADYDWTVKSLDGQDFKMTNAKGKVVFLNFWATWCPPCVAEMPSIERLHRALAPEGLAALTASTDQDEGALRRFVSERGLTLPVLKDPG